MFVFSLIVSRPNPCKPVTCIAVHRNTVVCEELTNCMQGLYHSMTGSHSTSAEASASQRRDANPMDLNRTDLRGANLFCESLAVGIESGLQLCT